MKNTQNKKEVFWVYHDADHGDIELFRTLKQAKEHAESCWPNEDGELEWEKSSRGTRLLWGEYVTVEKKEVNEQ